MSDPAGPPRRKVGNAYPTARKSSTPLMLGAGAVIIILAVVLFLFGSEGTEEKGAKGGGEVPKVSATDSVAAAENEQRADSAAKVLEDSTAKAKPKK